MTDLRTLATDVELEEKGAWVPYPLLPTLEIRIARRGNARWDAAFRTLIRDHREEMIKESEDDSSSELTDELEAGLYADTIVTGWRDTTLESGEEQIELDGEFLGCTRENVIKVLLDKQFHDLFTWIRQVAAQRAHYAAQQQEEKLGN